MGGAKRRSLAEDFSAQDDVWVADTVGEMGLLYRLFPNVFMGKSFFAGGGQNFLEPARLGCAVATGPRTQNFAQARDLAVSAGALTVVQSEEGLIAWLDARLADGARVPSFAPSGDLPAILAARLVGLMKAAGPVSQEMTAGVGGSRPVSAAPEKPRAQKPFFWHHGRGRLLGAALSPVSNMVAASTARRVARRGFRAPVPVICCGNAGVGGAGKTTLVLDFCARLRAQGKNVHVLTRGYGGSARGVVRVDPVAHGVGQVGDEALLLAAVSPTWKAADRAAAAAAALAAGATILLMDDGLQNPGLVKTASLLVIDGGYGFGNGRVLPAGPLREPVQAAAARCMGAVLIGADDTGALASLPPGLPVLFASLVPGAEILPLIGKRVLAFAGIGRPGKFFAMLRGAGVVVAREHPFPDHHVFSAAELVNLLELARDLDAVAVTTPKDFARIPVPLKPSFRVVGVSLAWEDETALKTLLDRACEMPHGA
jgi:tetraacyldisaccharide 4'-kinase